MSNPVLAQVYLPLDASTERRLAGLVEELTAAGVRNPQQVTVETQWGWFEGDYTPVGLNVRQSVVRDPASTPLVQAATAAPRRLPLPYPGLAPNGVSVGGLARVSAWLFGFGVITSFAASRIGLGGVALIVAAAGGTIEVALAVIRHRYLRVTSDNQLLIAAANESATEGQYRRTFHSLLWQATRNPQLAADVACESAEIVPDSDHGPPLPEGAFEAYPHQPQRTTDGGS